MKDAALDFTAAGLKKAGFDGFTTFAALLDGELERVPCEAGAYVVIRPSSAPRSFLESSCGGHFKGRNPTESASSLVGKWINDCAVLYIARPIERALNARSTIDSASMRSSEAARRSDIGAAATSGSSLTLPTSSLHGGLQGQGRPAPMSRLS